MLSKAYTLLHHTLVFALILMLSACGSSSNDGADNSAPGNDSTESISGTAATGAPINGFVYLRDRNGNPGNAMPFSIGADGSFTIETTDFEPPFILKARPDDGSADQFSYAAGPGVSNITPLTTLALFEAVNRTDVSTLFDDWSNRSDTLSQPEIQAFAQQLAQRFRTRMRANGVDPDNFNIFTSPFSANNSGFDAVLDELNIAIDFDSGSAIVNGQPFRLDDSDDGLPGTTPGTGEGNWTLRIVGTISFDGTSVEVDQTNPNAFPPGSTEGLADTFTEGFTGPDMTCSTINATLIEDTADRQSFNLSANCETGESFDLTYIFSR